MPEPQELEQLIHSLSPGALQLFKRQIASLPQTEREGAFSRLSGIPELADIVGRPSPVTTREEPIQKKPSPSIREEEAPFWQRALSTVMAPLTWAQQNISEPFAAIATAPFTPTTEATRDLPWFERTKAEYKGWEAPWGVKGAVEMLPWLAVPGIGAVGKAGTIAGTLGKLGTAGKVAGTALEYSPYGLAEKATGAALRGAGKGVKALVGAKAAPVTPEVTKIYYHGSPVKDLNIIKSSDGDWGSGVYFTTSKKGAVEYSKGRANIRRFVLGDTNVEPTLGTVYRIDAQPKNPLIINTIADYDKYLDAGEKRFGENTERNMAKWAREEGYDGIVNNRIQEGIIFDIKSAPIAQPIAPTAPAAKKLTSEMFPEGFTPDHEGAINQLTEIVKQLKPIRIGAEPIYRAARSKQAAGIEAIRVGEGTSVAAEFKKLGAAMKLPEGELPSQQLIRGLTPIPDDVADKLGVTLLDVLKKAPFKDEFEYANTLGALARLLDPKVAGIPRDFEFALLEKVFGSGLVKELLKKRPFGQRAWERTMDVLNAPRSLLSSTDISALLRQGGILVARHPIEGAQSVAPMIKALFSDANERLMDNIIRSRPGMDELIEAGLFIAPTVGKISVKLAGREEAFMSALMNKLPFVKASNRAYVTGINEIRSRSALNVLNGWKQAGVKYGEQDLKDLAQLINWASGRGNIPQWTGLAQKGSLMNATLFSPRLIFSRLQLPTTILPAVTESKLVRQEAWRTLLSAIGVGAGILTMAKLSGIATIELDPRSADFAKMRSGITRLDIWTGYSQYLRFAAQLATAQRKTEGGRIQTLNRKEVLDRFVQSKLSPAVGLINDILKGETFLGEEMPPKDASSVVGQLYERMMPLAVQDLIEAVQEDGRRGGVIASAGFLGVGVATYSSAVRKEQDAAARKQFGMGWEDVGKQYGKAAQLRIEQTTPAIIEAEREQEKRFAGTPSTMGQWLNEGKSIEETYRKAVNNAAAEFRALGNGALFKDKVDQAAATRRDRYGARAGKTEFQDIVAYYQQPLSQDQMDKMNPGDIVRKEFYQRLFSPDMYDQYGNYRFDEAAQREQEFTQRYGRQVMEYIEEYSASRWVDKPAELKVLEQARDTLKPLWQITDQIWSMYPEELHILSDQIQLAERTDPEAARRALRQYPQILRARELIARYRKLTRERNPEIEQAYRMFYR